jgi:hypothetical protein
MGKERWGNLNQGEQRETCKENVQQNQVQTQEGKVGYRYLNTGFVLELDKYPYRSGRWEGGRV